MEKTFQSLERGQRGRVKLHELRSADGGPHGPMEKHLEQWEEGMQRACGEHVVSSSLQSNIV